MNTVIILYFVWGLVAGIFLGIHIDKAFGFAEPIVILKVYPANASLPPDCSYLQKTICIFKDFNMTDFKRDFGLD